MAGDWIKFEIATLDKPEVWTISNELDIDPDAVIGKLLHVWAWFDQQSEKGNAPSVTKMLLDRKVGVSGFCDSLIRAGWMYEDHESSMCGAPQGSGVISLPNFERHNGKTAKNRLLTASRVAKHKSKVTEDKQIGNDPSVTLVTKKPLPKEEKRRYKNNDSNHSDDFEEIWKSYPKREGGNPKKQALSCYKARLKDGHSHEEILAGVLRYGKYVKAQGNENTPYVQQTKTFLGSGLGFTEEWNTEVAETATGNPEFWL